MESRDLTRLVGALYDAAGGAMSWSRLGEDLCRTMKADRAYLGLPQADGTLPNLLDAGDPMDEAYARIYHRIDPFRALAATAPPGARAVRRGTDILPPQELGRSEYVADYARRRRTPHSIGAQIDAQGEHLLGLFRSGAPFDDIELGQVEFLLPHLRRALQLRRTLAAPRGTRPTAGLAALDALPHAALLVDGAMRVAFANAEADRMTADFQSGLRIRRAGPEGGCVLVATHSADAAPLRGLVAATAAGGPGGGLRLRSPDTSGARAPILAVLVSPAPARLVAQSPAGAPEGVARGLAMVVAQNLARPAAPPPRILSDLFQLSPSEAAVAIAILGGATAEHVAETRGVSLNTVRRQIQTVLRKTEAQNLRDLERIAASLASIRQN